MKKFKTGLSVLVVTLAIAVAVSFVAISHSLIVSGKENKNTKINVSASRESASVFSSSVVSDTAASTVSRPTPSASNTQSEDAKPEVDLVGGKDGVFHKEIEIFYTEYSESGEITVKSVDGDKVIAPGTENEYDVYVKNIGEVPITYYLQAESYVSVDIEGTKVDIPIQASFCAPDNKYLLGDKNTLVSLGKLNGITHSQGLSPKHQAKYTLRWSWPFDGNDKFDTLLGNLAAEGEELTVKVSFSVAAVYDENAQGGSPDTGDDSSIGLWVAVFTVSVFILIILLFLRKKEDNEENA